MMFGNLIWILCIGRKLKQQVFCFSCTYIFSYSGKLPPARAAHGSVIMKKKLYIFGGYCSKFGRIYHFNDMWCLDFHTMEWEQIIYKGIKPAGRYCPILTPLSEDKFIIASGAKFNSTNSEQFFDSYMFDVSQKSLSPKVNFNRSVALGQSLLVSSSIFYFSHEGVSCYNLKKNSFEGIAEKSAQFNGQSSVYQYFFEGTDIFLWIGERIVKIPIKLKM